MSKSSAYTKKCRRNLWIFRIIDFICLFAPLVVYIFVALLDDGVVDIRKVTLTGTIVIALILTTMNVIAQKRLRCPIWIILIGLYVAIGEYLMPLIIILAVTSILDDLVFSPLIDTWKTRATASDVYDKRERV